MKRFGAHPKRTTILLTLGLVVAVLTAPGLMPSRHVAAFAPLFLALLTGQIPRDDYSPIMVLVSTSLSWPVFVGLGTMFASMRND